MTHSEAEFEPGQHVTGLPMIDRQTLRFVPVTEPIRRRFLRQRRRA